MVKVEDESGEIQTVKNLEILSAEKQKPYGSVLWIFRCRAVIHDILEVTVVHSKSIPIPFILQQPNKNNPAVVDRRISGNVWIRRLV